MAIHEDAAPTDDAAPPDAARPDGDADAPPDEQVARKEASMKSVFDKERGRGAMLAMEGGVIDQATTATAAEAAATAEFRPGERLAQAAGGDDLVIEEILGAGAFGEVYKAKVIGKKRWCGCVGRSRHSKVSQAAPTALALKSVKPSRLTPEKFRDAQVQLAEESAICFVIGLHPHIVSVHRVLSMPKGLLVALDLVEGTDLRKLAGDSYSGPLYQGGRAEANARVDSIVAQLYKGLAHLHGRAVLHMDLKPEVTRALSSLSRHVGGGGEGNGA